MNARTFLGHLNSLRPTIQFTMDTEKDGSLPFLDTLLPWMEDGSIDIEVYHTTAHTDRYLQYTSHHPQFIKRGVATCLFNCARTVAIGENIGKEERHVTEVLKASEYPEHTIRSVKRPKKKKHLNIRSAYLMCQD